MSTRSLFDPPEDSAGPGARGDRPVLRVAEVNRAARAVVEERWGDIWIQGELSDVTHAASGHVYFTLNDEQEPAQLRAVMFRGDARRCRAKLDKGVVVRVQGTLSIYEPRGTFQLIARLAVPAGEGDLHAQFERTRRKLEAEGLLDPARKRPLPSLPSVVGVVTSAAGAAMHDIIRVAQRRCPVRIVVADCRVQGQDAPSSIVAALEAIQKLPGLDVVIIGRGGGSAEDLWAFNDEKVARAIAACRVPIVSAVGHEVDVTIADLVADLRASTPSSAAETVVPDREALVSSLDHWHRRLEQGLETRIGRERLRLERLGRRLTDPRRAVGGVRRRLETLRAGVLRSGHRVISERRARLTSARDTLTRHDPRYRLARNRQRWAELRARLNLGRSGLVVDRKRTLLATNARLEDAGRGLVAVHRHALEGVVARMEALSPRAVLARGYAIALHGATGRALLNASEVQRGEPIRVLLHEGRLSAIVEESEEE